MAKDKNKPGEADEAKATEEKAPEASTTAPAADLAAQLAELRAKNAELEARLAASVPLVSAPEGMSGTGYWRVRLAGGPEHVVKASDAANAWETYRAEMGVITSESRPEVFPATLEQWQEAHARRHGLKYEPPTPADAVVGMGV